MLLWWFLAVGFLLIPLESADEDDVRAGTQRHVCESVDVAGTRLMRVTPVLPPGCSTAVNDLVYVVDGSWSVGVSDFDRAKQWLINITSQFDISSDYTQVTPSQV